MSTPKKNYNYLTTIKLTKHNIFLNVNNYKGDTLHKYSAGTEEYEGAKKKSTISKFDIATMIGTKLKILYIRRLRVRFTGRARYRRAVIKGLRSVKIRFYGEMSDTKQRAHNGCKLKKIRRKKKRG